MDHGIDDNDPFGVAALFLGQSLGHKYNCADEIDALIADLVTLETPQSPAEPVATVLAPFDAVLDRIESVGGLLELVEALLRLGSNSPPRTEVSQRLYRSVQWIMMRHDPGRATPLIVEILRDATPGGRVMPSSWPPHEFFAAALLLVYLGNGEARRELLDLVDAARDLDLPALAFVLEWYLDHQHSAPSR